MNDQELVLLKQIANAVFAEWGIGEPNPPYPGEDADYDPGSAADLLRDLFVAQRRKAAKESAEGKVLRAKEAS